MNSQQRWWFFIVLLIISIIAPTSGFAQTNDADKLEIRYFYLEADKKSGDAILLESPDGKRMLIDAGMEQTGQQLDRYLKQMQIDQIDYVISTHPHHDHIGGFSTILDSLDIGVLLMPNIKHSTKTYVDFTNLLTKQKIPYQYVKEGDRFTLGEDVEVEVISPSEEDLDSAAKEKHLSTADINNLSLVLKVTYCDNTFLFTGDLYKKQEKQLVAAKKELLNVDLLDAPHHGDSTSSSRQFINAVNPKYTIISANILQSKRVMKRYEQSGSHVYTTSKHQTIVITSDGKEIHVSG
ncbi:ComEC/Rec2 family competence protein [Halalkalibacter kiskunsagensis]|uniref:ComEC/Rec2 family competence protein n=1 Tax=Halalkalibacter kiskunsagensis TaxID=1548599 RepID=A0ABV6KH96_9BACI